jgi:hypothetical protein
MRTTRGASLRSLAILCFALTSFAHAFQQNNAKPELNPFERLPFQQWIAQGKVEQLPWKTSAFVIGLTNHQRLVARFVMQVKAKGAAHRNDSEGNGQIVGLLQLTDRAGRTYQRFGRVNVGEVNVELNDKDLVDYWDAFVLPGDYTVDFALYHSATGEHSFIERQLSVPPLKNDPLPEAWRDLPAVEFVDPAKPPDKETFFHPEINGKLYLPLATRVPVKIEMLFDLTPSELFHGSQSRFNRYLIGAVPTLKLFSQIAVQNGSLDMAMVDLLGQQVTFEQKNVKTLDWLELKKALNTTAPATINVRTLELRHPTPVFLRDELSRRINSEEARSDGNKPVQVFVIFSSSLEDYSFKDMEQKPLPENCSCRVYYLEYDFSRMNFEFNDTGNVEKMLRPLKTKSFRIHSPDDMRRALATILQEISQM